MMRMKAIEVIGHIDDRGKLSVDHPLAAVSRHVKVIILVPEAEDEEVSDVLWLQSLAANPAFADFAEEAEDIYNLSDGKPLNDEV